MNWDKLAETYGRQTWLERRAIRTLLDMLAIGERDSLLDVGTGPGVVLKELASRPVKPRHAIGVDSSQAMLEIAQGRVPGWEYLNADGADLPFADSSFDVVIASYLLHVLADRERASVVAEMARVLRPGGRVGVITVAPPGNALTTALFAPFRRLASRSDGRLAGMRSLDPREHLERSGIAESGRARSLSGYPSLCLTGTKH